MIATLTGDVQYIHEDHIILNVGGVGFLVHVTTETAMQARTGMQKTLFTHLVVREDNLSLFGFETSESRDYFIHLIGVGGVGPKTGLAILSMLNTDTIRRAITGEQADIFSRVPGIGKKTAQKIILHLQGRIKPLEPLEAAASMDDIDTEVLEALTGLGYSIVEAQAALQSIPDDAEEDVETRLRLALQYFS
jgi:Holliday junction DNA helicase RuvA